MELDAQTVYKNGKDISVTKKTEIKLHGLSP
jgi:hypothetical protein